MTHRRRANAFVADGDNPFVGGGPANDFTAPQPAPEPQAPVTTRPRGGDVDRGTDVTIEIDDGAPTADGVEPPAPPSTEARRKRAWFGQPTVPGTEITAYDERCNECAKDIPRGDALYRDEQGWTYCLSCAEDGLDYRYPNPEWAAGPRPLGPFEHRQAPVMRAARTQRISVAHHDDATCGVRGDHYWHRCAGCGGEVVPREDGIIGGPGHVLSPYCKGNGPEGHELSERLRPAACASPVTARREQGHPMASRRKQAYTADQWAELSRTYWILTGGEHITVGEADMVGRSVLEQTGSPVQAAEAAARAMGFNPSHMEVLMAHDEALGSFSQGRGARRRAFRDLSENPAPRSDTGNNPDYDSSAPRAEDRAREGQNYDTGWRGERKPPYYEPLAPVYPRPGDEPENVEEYPGLDLPDEVVPPHLTVKDARQRQAKKTRQWYVVDGEPGHGETILGPYASREGAEAVIEAGGTYWDPVTPAARVRSLWTDEAGNIYGPAEQVFGSQRRGQQEGPGYGWDTWEDMGTPSATHRIHLVDEAVGFGTLAVDWETIGRSSPGRDAIVSQEPGNFVIEMDLTDDEAATLEGDEWVKRVEKVSRRNASIDKVSVRCADCGQQGKIALTKVTDDTKCRCGSAAIDFTDRVAQRQRQANWGLYSDTPPGSEADPVQRSINDALKALRDGDWESAADLIDSALSHTERERHLAPLQQALNAIDRGDDAAAERALRPIVTGARRRKV